jgi:hypothetical protein
MPLCLAPALEAQREGQRQQQQHEVREREREEVMERVAELRELGLAFPNAR